VKKAEKEKATLSLKKARSHIKNIIDMIENEADCLSILQQNRAIAGLLKSAQASIVQCHLCESIENKDLKKSKDKEALIKNLSRMVNLFNK
jgi:DNA-binding FrmR family transcriptional regulator